MAGGYNISVINHHMSLTFCYKHHHQQLSTNCTVGLPSVIDQLCLCGTVSRYSQEPDRSVRSDMIKVKNDHTVFISLFLSFYFILKLYVTL